MRTALYQFKFPKVFLGKFFFEPLLPSFHFICKSQNDLTILCILYSFMNQCDNFSSKCLLRFVPNERSCLEVPTNTFYPQSLNQIAANPAKEGTPRTCARVTKRSISLCKLFLNYHEPNVHASFFNCLQLGYLTKQGGLVKSWRRRWFVLNENKLYYYDSDVRHLLSCLYSLLCNLEHVDRISIEKEGVVGNNRFGARRNNNQQ